MLRHDDPPREDQTSTLLPGSAKKYNPESVGGGCYITFLGLGARLRA